MNLSSMDVLQRTSVFYILCCAWLNSWLLEHVQEVFCDVFRVRHRGHKRRFFPSNLSSLNPNRISEFLCKLFLPRPSWYGRATESRRSYSFDVFVRAALVWVVHFLVENEVKVKNSSNSLLRFLTESAAGSHKHAATAQKLRLKAWKDIA